MQTEQDSQMDQGVACPQNCVQKKRFGARPRLNIPSRWRSQTWPNGTGIPEPCIFLGRKAPTARHVGICHHGILPMHGLSRQQRRVEGR